MRNNHTTVGYHPYTGRRHDVNMCGTIIKHAASRLVFTYILLCIVKDVMAVSEGLLPKII